MLADVYNALPTAYLPIMHYLQNIIIEGLVVSVWVWKGWKQLYYVRL